MVHRNSFKKDSKKIQKDETDRFHTIRLNKL